MSKLQLYLRGTIFQELEIKIPPHQSDLVDDPAVNFEMNVELRSEFIKAEALKFKIQYLRQIIKCNYEYEIYLQVESKIDEPYFLTTETD